MNFGESRAAIIVLHPIPLFWVKTIVAGCVKVVMYALVKESNDGLMSLMKLVMNCWNDFLVAFDGVIWITSIKGNTLFLLHNKSEQ